MPPTFVAAKITNQDALFQGKRGALPDLISPDPNENATIIGSFAFPSDKTELMHFPLNHDDLQ